MTFQEYKELVELANKMSDAYYNGEPIATDEEFDNIVKRIKEYERENSDKILDNSPTQIVGAKVKDSDVKHKHRMYSMNDVFTIEEAIEWMGRYKGNYSVENKYDGASLKLIYENGIFKQAITRGDGFIGKDVTELAKNIRNIPHSLDKVLSVEISGEVLMFKSELEKLNSLRIKEGKRPYSNPRNAASGLLNVKEGVSIGKHLFFNPWAIYESLTGSHYRDMISVNELGFRLLELPLLINSSEKLKEIYEATIKSRDSKDYIIDGLAIKVDNIRDREKIGYTSKYPKWSIALKLPALERVTRLKDIKWQIGRTGVLTPVGEVEPVDIDGVTVTRVTLHNYREIEILDLKINDYVAIIRSGDVIPKLVNVFKDRRDGSEMEIEIPNECPICHSELHRDDVNIFCINIECQGRLKEHIKYFVSRDIMDIRGLGDQIVEKLVDEGIVKSLIDIYYLDKDKLVPIAGEKNSEKILESIEVSKSNELYRFIACLGIEGVGVVNAKIISNEFGKDFINKSKDEYMRLQGIGEIVANNIVSYLNKNKLFISKFMNILYLRINKKQGPLKDKKIVITGKFDMPRNEIKKIIEENGGEVSSSVSKNIDYLLAGIDTGSKLDKAKRLNIKIITLEELLKYLK